MKPSQRHHGTAFQDSPREVNNHIIQTNKTLSQLVLGNPGWVASLTSSLWYKAR